MLFKVGIKNFGKLTDATIRIGKFTVFAGSNNTGKSFVSKALYSIFGAMNANHLDMALDQNLKPLFEILSKMELAIEDGFDGSSLSAIEDTVKDMHKVATDVAVSDDTDEFRAIEKALPAVHEYLDKINAILPQLQSEARRFWEEREGTIGEDVPFHTIFDMDDINNMDNVASTLQAMKDWDTQKFVVSGLGSEIRHHLLQNFQVNRLASLHGDSRSEVCFEIDGIGNVEIGENDGVGFDMTRAGLHQLQKYSRVLYLESPVYWRLRNPLENVSKMPRLSSRRERITGVPKYFYDMSGALRESYSGETDFPEVLKRLTSPKVLGGKIAADKSGDLSFQDDKGGNYPLPLAAMGIANLGMLALLIEKNLLDKNTFLFVDEPEAHLHPAWQVEMAEALFALAEKGVNVVIATHSADILKWLEVCIKKNPKLGDIVALNHFRKNGVNANGGELMPRLNAVQKELVSPYYDLYYEGLQ